MAPRRRLRIGSGRLLTLQLDPAGGVACWDENALSVVRRYELLSPVVGLRVLEHASTEWTDTEAGCDPGAVIDHPEFGPISALDITRRNAHEVVHHTMDIANLCTAITKYGELLPDPTAPGQNLIFGSRSFIDADWIEATRRFFKKDGFLRATAEGLLRSAGFDEEVSPDPTSAS